MRGGVQWRCIGGWGGNVVGILDRRLTVDVHQGHSLLHETIALYGLLVSLITKILLDPGTHGNRALVLIAVFGVRYAEQDKLLADLTHVPLV